MKYMGSKSKIAKYIVPIIQEHIDNNNIKIYIEPFAGGMNVIDKIKCEKKIASDLNKYVIELFKHLKSGGELLNEVTREVYSNFRVHKFDGQYQDWEVGNVGFLASYNGRFFDGGYAQPGYEKTKNGERYRDYYLESKRNIMAQIGAIKDIEFYSKNYKEWSTANCLIYVDPPYKGTKGYGNSKEFNYDEFWNIIRAWSGKNIVIISEENAPEDFKCIWEKEVSRSIKAADKSKSTEKLFMLV